MKEKKTSKEKNTEFFRVFFFIWFGLVWFGFGMGLVSLTNQKESFQNERVGGILRNLLLFYCIFAQEI